jgi:hypothetical protein
MKIGTTYAHPHIDYLGLDQEHSLHEMLDFGFDIVRLGCYWNECEPVEGTFNFSRMKNILDHCEERHLEVVMCVGMKAPRHPEYYIPDWLGKRSPERIETEVLRFVKVCVEELRSYSCITHWHVENEPLDPSGPNGWAIPEALLRKEVELVRVLDIRPIVVNFWGNELSKRGLLPLVKDYADIVGLDIYYKVPLDRIGYWHPNDSDRKLKKIIQNFPKPVWITELQAEPWEAGVNVSDHDNPGSMNPDLLRENFVRVKQFDCEVILLWGFEYWLWRKSMGDTRMWDAAKELVLREKR